MDFVLSVWFPGSSMLARFLMFNAPRAILCSLALAATVTACAPSFSQLVASGGGLEAESDEVDPREQQRFDEALQELRRRADERAAAAALNPGPTNPMDALPIVVAAPPSPWTDDGRLRRFALDQLIDAGPHAVLALAEWTPVRQQDRAIGLELRNPRYASELLAAIGLRDGDVIRSVNGESVLLPDAFVRAWEGLADCQSITINIERGGTPVSLTLEVEDGTASAQAASN